MSLMQTMLGRRSVRKFIDEPLTEEQLAQVVGAGMTAPTGKGIRPWQFIVITDPNMIRQMVGCRQGGAAMLRTATAVIAVLGDTTKSDTCIEDSSLVLGYMHLMASSMGLGSCWLQVRLRPSDEEGVSSEEYLRARLGFPEQMRLEALLALGHPAQSPAARTVADLPADRVHVNHW